MQISENLPLKISAASLQQFMLYVTKSIMALCKPGFIVDQYG
jgi:hypothetical protein